MGCMYCILPPPCTHTHTHTHTHTPPPFCRLFAHNTSQLRQCPHGFFFAGAPVSPPSSPRLCTLFRAAGAIELPETQSQQSIAAPCILHCRPQHDRKQYNSGGGGRVVAVSDPQMAAAGQAPFVTPPPFSSHLSADFQFHLTDR